MINKAYTYQPLQHVNSTRLVVIHPGPSDEPVISCSIAEYRLEHEDYPLPYEALSYTWGDATKRSSIMIEPASRDDSPTSLDITSNCYNALKSLRLKDVDRRIWVDSISINQQDMNERTLQVRRMNWIYYYANHVVVYVGEENAGSRLLFQELCAIEGLDRETVRLRPLPNAEFIQVLEEFLSRPWFSRVWVLQEVYRPSRRGTVVLMCGAARTTFEALRTCVWGYHGTVILVSMTLTRFFVLSHDTINGIDMFRGSNMNRLRPDHVAIEKLRYLLARTRNHQATDPRDRIIALLPLGNIGNPKLNAVLRYDQTVEWVFTETALLFFPNESGWLFCFARHPHSLKMPSWVPDWSQNTNLDGYCDLNDTYIEQVDDWRSENPISSLGSSDRAILELLYTRKPPVVRYDTCAHDYCRNAHLVLQIQGVQRSSVVAIGPVFDYKNSKKLCQQSILRLVMSAPDIRKEDGNESIFHAPFEILQAFQRQKKLEHWRDIQNFLSRGNGGSLTRLDELREQNEDLTIQQQSKALTDIQEAMDGCCLIVDSVGLIGIAPHGTRVGDVICQFEGPDSWPLETILRPREPSGWTLISGACYRHRRDYKSDNSMGLTEFVIW